jgi:hypothetical protein
MPTCLEWGEERHQECSQTADEGYNECSQTADHGYRDCCDWWPCSWACDAWVWVSNIVCVAWTWVSNVVCVAWTWITTAVCILWDVVTTIVNAVLVTLESVLGWVLSALTFIIQVLEMIPILGTLIRWIINIVTHIISIVFSLGDAFLGLIGIRPEKLLRVCTIILRDENGNPVGTVADAVTLLQLAANVYKRDANVRVIPSRAFKYSSGFAGAETVDESWVTTDDGNSDSTLLDVPCDAGSDWLLTGSGFQAKSSTMCFFQSWRNLVGYGGPVSCFLIRDVVGSSIGCALWITDYATIEGSVIQPPPGSPRTLGHEVGHACNLWHTCVDDDNRNIMATQDACDPDSGTPPDRVNPRMSDGQAILVRMSKHVTYF